ncbi:MAG: CPBP family intramembrane metalloprotease [Deltaproteobacteria bacterium]|nr:CPBP family intramembrane metalloprotease [Deltaproteobacteria bacterium]
MILTCLMTLLATAVFVPLFITRGIGPFDFWWWMSANITLLLFLAALLDKDGRADISDDIGKDLLFKIGCGLLSALGLYIVFMGGNIVSRAVFPFAGRGIEDVYAFKTGASHIRILLLMTLLIGPGEELFWRGFLQRRFQSHQGPFKGYLLATAVYTLIHAGSGNLMLVLAAGICGLFWGYLYLRTGSIIINVVSHTAWDIAIFLLLPVGGL